MKRFFDSLKLNIHKDLFGKYPASRGFSLAWLLAFTKSFAWLVCYVDGLFTPREKPLQEAACGFRWACSLDTSKILEVDTWLTGFRPAFNQLNNSRALILDQFAALTGARVRLSPATRVSKKRSEQRSFIELNCSITKSFYSWSVRGVVWFSKWRCLRKFSNRSRKIHIYLFALLRQFRNNLQLKILQNPVFLSILNN